MDIRQSEIYAEFMERIGWKVEKVGEGNAFVKTFPVFGSFVKIQRIKKPLSWQKIKNLAKKHRAFKVIIEPDISRRAWSLEHGAFRKANTPYLPSKTIKIDLTKSEKEIFSHFAPSARRAIRRAIRNKVKVSAVETIDPLIKLKSKQMFPFGFLMRKEIKILWNSFSPDNAASLLANHLSNLNCLSKTVAAVCLLFFRKKAYYWLAASSGPGRKLSAPSLLVWEAIRLSKKKGCKVFDFEGIYDSRFSQATKSWQGFTRFKKGFGGEVVEYPLPFTLAKQGR